MHMCLISFDGDETNRISAFALSWSEKRMDKEREKKRNRRAGGVWKKSRYQKFYRPVWEVVKDTSWQPLLLTLFLLFLFFLVLLSVFRHSRKKMVTLIRNQFQEGDEVKYDRTQKRSPFFAVSLLLLLWFSLPPCHGVLGVPDVVAAGPRIVASSKTPWRYSIFYRNRFYLIVVVGEFDLRFLPW